MTERRKRVAHRPRPAGEVDSDWESLVLLAETDPAEAAELTAMKRDLQAKRE